MYVGGKVIRQGLVDLWILFKCEKNQFNRPSVRQKGPSPDMKDTDINMCVCELHSRLAGDHESSSVVIKNMYRSFILKFMKDHLFDNEHKKIGKREVL